MPQHDTPQVFCMDTGISGHARVSTQSAVASAAVRVWGPPTFWGPHQRGPMGSPPTGAHGVYVGARPACNEIIALPRARRAHPSRPLGTPVVSIASVAVRRARGPSWSVGVGGSVRWGPCGCAGARELSRHRHRGEYPPLYIRNKSCNRAHTPSRHSVTSAHHTRQHTRERTAVLNCQHSALGSLA
jgi:hypothetical protein